jgi:hypothetical protein
MPRVDYPATVSERGLSMEDSEGFHRQVVALFKQGAKLWVTVEEDRPLRSRQQNRYYWGVVMRIASDTLGYTPDEMHEICKGKFLKRTWHIGEEDVEGTGSTKRLNTVEMSEYTDHVRRWLAENGVDTPDPGE